MKIRDLFFPPKCAACGSLLDMSMFSEPFCERCMAKWEFAKRSVVEAHHGQPIRVFFDNDGDEYGRAMFLLYYEPSNFNNVESKLLFSLKDRGEERSVDFAARELADMIRRNVPFLDSVRDNSVIVWIPRRIGAVRRYGFDHMERVAKRLSYYLSVPSNLLLHRRLFAFEQKNLSLAERKRNAHSTMTLVKGANLINKTVILIDDIITTGASLEAAASLLMNAGATQVISVVLCATEREQADIYRADNGFNIIKNRKSKETPADFECL